MKLKNLEVVKQFIYKFVLFLYFKQTQFHTAITFGIEIDTLSEFFDFDEFVNKTDSELNIQL